MTYRSSLQFRKREDVYLILTQNCVQEVMKTLRLPSRLSNAVGQFGDFRC